jgi:hypothetical protein
MRANLPSDDRPSARAIYPCRVHELSAAGRLAAWGTAALTGAVSPDDAADQVTGSHDPAHRVLGLPGEETAVNLPYALARLRSLGVGGLRLVLPRPGDVAGLPGPAAFNERAVARGEAVLTVGGPALALLGEGRGIWSVSPVATDRRTPLSLTDAARELDEVMREATALLVRLDVARWEPAAAEVLAARSEAARPQLPMSADPRAHVVLSQGLRIAAVVDLARAGDGSALTAEEVASRADVLRGLDRAARRAIEAACSIPVSS